MSQKISNDAAVSLFLVDAALVSAQQSAILEQFLNDAERRRTTEIKDAARRAEYVIAHAMLRRLLSPMVNVAPPDVRFSTEPNGRPCLHADHGSAVQFSISHTAGLIALVVHPVARLGVDVESLAKSRDARALAQRFFHPQEQRYVDDAVDESEAMLRMLRCWTMKEAWFKALGGSSSWVLSDLCFAFDDERSKVTSLLPSTSNEVSDVQLWSAAIGGQHVGSLVWRDSAPTQTSAVHAVRVSAIDLNEEPAELTVRYTSHGP